MTLIVAHFLWTKIKIYLGSIFNKKILVNRSIATSTFMIGFNVTFFIKLGQC